MKTRKNNILRGKLSRTRTTKEPVSEIMDPRLFSAILHQFRLPLNVIVGFADLLKNPDLDSKTRNIYSNYIYHNSTPLLHLLENMIDLFSVETKQITIKHEECNVNAVFDEVFNEFTHRNSYDLQETDTSGGLTRSGHMRELVIRSDSGRLKKALTNIISNSFQFSGLPKIEIGYTIQENSLEFYIIDKVQGLTVDNLDAVLAECKSNNAIQNQSLIVASLRLIIAQKLIHAMGGKIWTKKNNGIISGHFFSIPLELIEKPVEPTAKHISREIPSWANYNLLIAEDIESNYIYLAELLKPTNIQVTWARNGKEAVDIVQKSSSFDLILMDILMPEMDGYEAAKLIKESNPEIPIVVQTAYSLDNEPEDILSNFDGFLTKPIWSEELIRILSKFIIPREVV